MHQLDEKSPIELINGINYVIDPNQHIESELLRCGHFESDTTDLISRFCGEGMVALDIGANIGAHTLLMARQVTKSGSVIAFEPTTYAHQRLVKNISLNSFKNILVEKIGLSDETKVEEVCFASSWSPEEHRPAIANVPELVRLMRLDDYLRENGIHNVDFIKLDVDGFETKIIRGALKTLNTFEPRIVFEVCPHRLAEQGSSPSELLDLLSSIGYQFFHSETLSRYETLDAITSRIPDGSSINVLACLCQVQL